MAGENPREEILTPPEYPLLEFGDGYVACATGSIEFEEDGIKWLEVTIEPSEILKKRYNIKDSELKGGKSIIIKIKRNDVILMNPFDAANNKWLYIKNYRGESTEIANIGWDLRKRLEESERKRRILEGENTWYSEQLLLAKTNPIEFAGQTLEIFEKITANTIEALKTKKEKEE
jgi:hypothetical protein